MSSVFQAVNEINKLVLIFVRKVLLPLRASRKFSKVDASYPCLALIVPIKPQPPSHPLTGLSTLNATVFLLPTAAHVRY